MLTITDNLIKEIKQWSYINEAFKCRFNCFTTFKVLLYVTS